LIDAAYFCPEAPESKASGARAAVAVMAGLTLLYGNLAALP